MLDHNRASISAPTGAVDWNHPLLMSSDNRALVKRSIRSASLAIVNASISPTGLFRANSSIEPLFKVAF